MDIMSVALWSVWEKMLDEVKKGRVSDGEVEVTAGGDQEPSVGEAPETNSLCPSIPQRIESKKENPKLKLILEKVTFELTILISYLVLLIF